MVESRRPPGWSRGETSISGHLSDCSSRASEGRKGSPHKTQLDKPLDQAGLNNSSTPPQPHNEEMVLILPNFRKQPPGIPLSHLFLCLRHMHKLGPNTAGPCGREEHQLQTAHLTHLYPLACLSTSSVFLGKCFSLGLSSRQWTREELDTTGAHSLPESTEEGWPGLGPSENAMEAAHFPPQLVPRPALVC